MQRRTACLGAAPPSQRARNAAATTGVPDILTEEFPQTLTEVHVEDIVENEVTREVDRL